MDPAPMLPRYRRLVPALFRALLSTVVIGVVAFVAFALRVGRLQLSDGKALFAEYWAVLLAIFCGLSWWDCASSRRRAVRLRREKERES